MYGKKLLAPIVLMLIFCFAIAKADSPMQTGGCLGVVVQDAVNATAVSAEVTLVGACLGSGCPGIGVYIKSEQTDISGAVSFDERGTSTMFSPLWGDGTGLFVTITAPGYHPLTIYHEPDWSYTEERGFYSVLDNVWLAKDTDVDSDGDGLYDSQELRIGTDPHNWDTDGDGLSDFAEVYGSQYQDLRRYGASPLRKDIFVECDYYRDYKPNSDAMEDVIQAFSEAPVSNPDGSMGINLVIDIDDEIASEDAPSVLDLTNDWQDYRQIRHDYFTIGRDGLYHYCVWASQYDIGEGPSNSTGRAKVLGDYFLVTMLPTTTPNARIKHAGTFMHELGHNLGLLHHTYGGSQNANSYQPNCFSVMSYLFQLSGLTLKSAPNERFVDYSRASVPSLDELYLDERLGFKSSWASQFIPRYAEFLYADEEGDHFKSTILDTVGSEVDFNHNGVIDFATVSAELDGNQAFNMIPSSQNDWDVLDYSSGNSIRDNTFEASLMAMEFGPWQMLNVRNSEFSEPLIKSTLISEQILIRKLAYVNAITEEDTVECSPLEE